MPIRRTVRWLLATGIGLALWWTTSVAECQTTEPAPAAGTPDESVQMNFAEEVELEALVEYISRHLNVKILYDEKLADKKIRIKSPGKIPNSTFLGILQSALRMKGLTLVDADVPGWKRIEQVQNLAALAPTGDAQEILDRQGASTAVTQTFVLKHADLQQVDQAIKPFLTQAGGVVGGGGGNSITIKDQRILIVTDFATNLIKIAKLIDLIDQPKQDAKYEFYRVEHVEVAVLAQQISAILAAKAKAQGAGLPTTADAKGTEVVQDVRTNQLVFVGTPEHVQSALQLARSLDVPVGATTEVYAFRYVQPERVERLVKELVSPIEINRAYRSVVDADGNALVVTTTPEVHAKIATIKERIDTQQSTTIQSPVRFYKLLNATVDDVLSTLLLLEDAQSIPGREGTLPEAAVTPFGGTAPGRTTPPGAPPPANPVEVLRLPLPPGAPTGAPQSPATGTRPMDRSPRSLNQSRQRPLSTGTLPGGARVTADPNTNSLIVVATPEVHKVYEELIKSLDKRRPQVLIEAKIVAIDTSDNYQLGVEVSVGDRIGDRRLFSFSSYGLSTVDATTGALKIIPGLGFNGTLVDPTSADVVVRALANHRRARVLAAPKVLVNDNSEGELQSVLSIPFSSVNASQTVSTTSFGGNQSAGTIINVTPHIGQGDHLQLDFSIEFSNFNGPTSSAPGALPPPRQVDKVDSIVTIPDGHTVIVGGLNRNAAAKTINGMPFTEDIPLLKYALGNRITDRLNTSLFVFLRPIILRDDKFKDLKFLSDRDVTRARIPGKYPESQTILIR